MVRAVEILHRVEQAILVIHQPIKGITGAVCGREIKSKLEVRRLITQRDDFLLNGAGEVSFSPFTQAADTLRKMGFSGGVIGVPHFLTNQV